MQWCLWVPLATGVSRFREVDNPVTSTHVQVRTKKPGRRDCSTAEASLLAAASPASRRRWSARPARVCCVGHDGWCGGGALSRTIELRDPVARGQCPYAPVLERALGSGPRAWGKSEDRLDSNQQPRGSITLEPAARASGQVSGEDSPHALPIELRSPIE